MPSPGISTREPGSLPARLVDGCPNPGVAVRSSDLTRSGSFLAFRITFPRLQAEKQLSAVGKCDALANRTSGLVLGLVALDHDLGAGRQRVLGKAEPVQIVRAAALDHPGYHLAVVALHVHVDPGVRIGHFPFHDGAL